ncbi:MAG: CBS domain-containing protein, partial [Planctomycetes bacterium]|nr:CBS domain-containing protein [Planctomycetota bacterium]
LVLILSNSGETEEIVSLLSPVKKIGAAIISITGEPKSTLGRHSDVVLDLGKIEEACPLGLAPSASSTAMLALGDALALTVARRRKFTKEDYALYHPGGELGRKLLTVDKVMRTGKANPVVRCDATVREALRVMTETAGSPGATSVVDKAGKLVGFFTDGDMRRRLPSNPDLLDERVEAVMTRNPKRVTSGHLASEALRMLRDYKIDQLPVVNAKGKLIGILDVQDLLDVGKVETEA